MDISETWWGMNEKYRTVPEYMWNDEIINDLIRGAAQSPFRGDIPPEFSFLETSWIRFYRLGLSSQEKCADPAVLPINEFELAFNQFGVKVPGTPYRFRCERALFNRVELADGSETATLPEDWKDEVVPW